MVTPQAKRQMLAHVVAAHPLSKRRACRLLNLSRSSASYQAKASNDEPLRQQLKVLATQYPAYGYLMLHSLLKQQGLVVNKKRTYRLYCEEKLQMRTKQRKKLKRPFVPLVVPTGINQRWSMDFVADQLSCGRRFRILNVIDDYSRECVGQLVANSITGQQVARYLAQLFEQRGKPQRIVCDNGTEFTSKAMFFFAKEHQFTLGFIQPGKPTQNAFVESFNGKFRQACLNQHWFRSLNEARHEIEAWRLHYNSVRPHSALNYLAPLQFLKQVA